MHESVLTFAGQVFDDLACAGSSIRGLDVLEVGSLDYNGSVRPLVMAHNPGSYLGTDMLDGPGVDRAILAENLGFDVQFDVVICCEVMEHVENWQESIRGITRACKLGSLLVLSTRGPGFPYHGYPHDYWRYTPDIMNDILTACGFRYIKIKSDRKDTPGILCTAIKTSEIITSLDNVRFPPIPMPQPVLSNSRSGAAVATLNG